MCCGVSNLRRCMASVSLIGMNENAQELGNIKACALGNLSDLLPFQVGHSWLPRCQSADQSPGSGRGLHVLGGSLPYMESLLTCLQMNWMAILVRVRFSLASSPCNPADRSRPCRSDLVPVARRPWYSWPRSSRATSLTFWP